MPTRPNAEPDPLARAADWFARLHGSNQVDEAERQAWLAWLASDPAHTAAWHRVEALNQRFQRLGDKVDVSAASQALRSAQAERPSRRRNLKLLGLAGLALGTGWLAMRAEPWQDLVADAHTATGERRDLLLPDGTHLWLNTDTAVQVDYNDTERRVRLLRGEVLVETAPDPRGRPWLLALDEGQLRPLGTRFSVWKNGADGRLAVFEGHVDLRPAAAPAGRVLAPGEQVRFRRDALAPTQPVTEALAAWTRGMLVADGMPLAELCQELRRHQHAVISCADEVAALRVVGAFPLDAPERVFEALEYTLPVRIFRPLPWWVRIGPA